MFCLFLKSSDACIIIICFRTLYVIHECKKGNIPFRRCNSSFPVGEGDRGYCIGQFFLHYFGNFNLQVWYSPNLQDVFFGILDDICVNQLWQSTYQIFKPKKILQSSPRNLEYSPEVQTPPPPQAPPGAQNLPLLSFHFRWPMTQMVLSH